jgi:endo-1,4-beta-xylanase
MIQSQTRRGLMLAAGAAALAGPTQASSAFTAEPSLADLARAGGRFFGSAVGAGDSGVTASLGDATYRDLLKRECGMLVCENEMKWYVLRPDPTTFDFTRADRIADFARDNGLDLRGHTLLWHHPQWFPAWVETHDFGPQSATAAEAMLVDHIQRLAARYPQILSWDVVNETVDAETGELRETPLSRAMGQSVLDVAFHAAREAAPQAQLVYNDYMSWEAGHEKHRAGVLRLLEGFKARGVPIDALGVQSHIGSGNSDDSVGFDTAQEREWRAFMDEVTGMGLEVVITEFDVHDKNLPADIPTRDAAVADLARRYLDLMLSYPQTTGVVAWGMMDSHSWLQNNWPRADGLPKRPTPYDARGRAKPLRQAIADAFRAAPPRPAERPA